MVRDDLPSVAPAALSLRARVGADPWAAAAVTAGLRTVLDIEEVQQPGRLVA
ncbi:hypothetical protein ACWKSP_05035 [Micromonosporaceae bacterium Da 78-11]